MSKLEKKIILFAILFIVIYLGAIVVTLQSRKTTLQKTTRIESAVVVSEEEAPLMLAELLLPMAVLSTLTLCFILARRRRSRTYQKLDDTEEAGQ